MAKKSSFSNLPLRQQVWISPNWVKVGRKNVALTSIGIRHGDFGLPLGRNVQKVLRTPLSKEKGLILTEADSTSHLPKEFVKKANTRDIGSNRSGSYTLGTRLETLAEKSKPKLVMALGTILGISIPQNLNRLVGDTLFEPQVIHSLPPRASVEALKGKRVLFLCKLLGVNKKEFAQGSRIIITAKSVLLAANAINYIQHNKASSASVVTGAGHTSEIHKFISQPKLAVRYIDKILNKIPRNLDSFSLVLALENARETFQQQLPAHERKTITPSLLPYYSY